MKRTLKALEKNILEIKKAHTARSVGEVLEVKDGIAKLQGLDEAAMGEELIFPERGARGLVLNLTKDSLGVVIFGDWSRIRQGDTAETVGRSLGVPVGKEVLGRVLDALGNPIDDLGKLETEGKNLIERQSPGIIDRQSVFCPLQTGIKAIDSMIPIGRGQRELIIGDRSTGKTSLAIDTIINQKDSNVFCVYVAIGQKRSKVARIVAKLKDLGAMDYTTVISASASESAVMNYLAPYTGCAIGEYFRDSGQAALVVYDDLSKHAVSYREISLLLRRPPGREAYPGDVFYLHSRLLERAAQMSEEKGGGSLTALPIVETKAGDVSAYIPTNVISITDGQIYLETDLFYAGIRPALNIGLSVSRVGSAAQTKAMKRVASKLRLELAQFRELQAFAQFGADLEKDTRKKIERGERLSEVLKQVNYRPLPLSHQVVVLFIVTAGLLDEVPIEEIAKIEERFIKTLERDNPEILKNIEESKELSEDVEENIKKALKTFINDYS